MALKMQKLSPDAYLILAYKRQSTARDILVGTGSGVCACRICRKHGAEFVAIQDYGGNQVGYAGIQTCKLNWVCPICSVYSSRNRRAKMSALAVRQRQHGNSAMMLTYTVSHSYDQPLRAVLNLLNDSYKKMHSGAGWESIREQIGYVGAVKTVEINLGVNGWHAHIHELLFADRPINNLYGFVPVGKMRARWLESVAFNKGYANENNGFNVVIGYGKASDYLTKWGIVPELINNGLKNARDGGYSPFQLLDIVACNSRLRSWAKSKFYEYYSQTIGLHQFNPSPSLKAEFKDSAKDKSDIALELEPLALLNSAQWAFIWENGLRANLLIAAKAGFLHKWLGETIPKNLD